MSETRAESNLQTIATTEIGEQYGIWQILGIWAGSALPMGLSYWVIMPILLSRGSVNPFMYLFLVTFGLVWQGVLAFIILKREVRPFTWQGLKDRLWLYIPSNPKTRIPSKRLYLWTIPLVILMQAYFGIGVMDWLNDLWMKVFPFLTPPPYTIIQNLAGPAVGQWWLMGVLVVMIVFNYLLGEELIFRGILLPKMNGVFGKWDWLANHLLFVTYHLHKIADWPAFLLIDWITPWATKRFKSYWVAVVLHGVEALMLIYMFPLAIMGLV